MKRVSKIKFSVLFTLIATADGVINFFQRIIDFDKKGVIMNIHIHDIVQIISMIAIFAISYYLLGSLDEIRMKLRLALIVSQVRDIVTFDEKYGNVKALLLPDESIESYINRTPEGIYNQRLQEEIKQVRDIAIATFKNSNIEYIDEMIKDSYELIYSNG